MGYSPRGFKELDTTEQLKSATAVPFGVLFCLSILILVPSTISPHPPQVTSTRKKKILVSYTWERIESSGYLTNP